MTVIWFIKIVDEWVNECAKNKVFDKCFNEADRKFGLWIYSASYASCFELRERVENYLKEKGVSLSDLWKVSHLFCGPLETEIEYEKRLYELLKEALNHVAETSEEKIISIHAKNLIELIKIAEQLKSEINCSG